MRITIGLKSSKVDLKGVNNSITGSLQCLMQRVKVLIASEAALTVNEEDLTADEADLTLIVIK